MEIYMEVHPEVIKENIGNYICLDGKGLLSGLDDLSTKYNCQKIVGLENDYVNGWGHIIVMKCYGAKNNVILPRFYWDQACAILTKKEYQKLPSPSWARRKHG